VVSEEWNSQILVDLHVTMYQGALVARRRHLDCNTCSLPDVGAGSEPPYGTCVVCHGMDQLLVQQDPVRDG